MADSSDRTESDAVEEFSKGEREEAADSPARRIPSRIGPAEAEKVKRVKQTMSKIKADRIFRNG